MTTNPDPVVHLDPRTFAPVGVSVPCPSRATAHLGIADPNGVSLPCGLLLDHDPPHRFLMEWTDPPEPTSLGDRLAAGEPKIRRPH